MLNLYRWKIGFLQSQICKKHLHTATQHLMLFCVYHSLHVIASGWKPKYHCNNDNNSNTSNDSWCQSHYPVACREEANSVAPSGIHQTSVSDGGHQIKQHLRADDEEWFKSTSWTRSYIQCKELAPGITKSLHATVTINDSIFTSVASKVCGEGLGQNSSLMVSNTFLFPSLGMSNNWTLMTHREAPNSPPPPPGSQQL